MGHVGRDAAWVGFRLSVITTCVFEIVNLGLDLVDPWSTSLWPKAIPTRVAPIKVGVIPEFEIRRRVDKHAKIHSNSSRHGNMPDPHRGKISNRKYRCGRKPVEQETSRTIQADYRNRQLVSVNYNGNNQLALLLIACRGILKQQKPCNN